MPQPVKLSDALISVARDAAKLANRSLASQVEHWATLGRAIEGALNAEQTGVLKRGVQEARGIYRTQWGADISQRLAEAIERTQQPTFGAEVRDLLLLSSQPAYGAHPDFPGKLVRRDPGGRLTPGRIVNRTFVPDGEVSERSAE